MVAVRLYVEGGGDHDHALRTRCQEGFSRFLATVLHHKPRIVACGGRQQAFDRFRSALENQPDVTNVLLVDAEAPVTAARVWDHLRMQARWQRPPTAPDDSAHLMVQCMEAWFVADRASTERFFGSGWKAAKFRKWPDIESLKKDQLFDALRDASRDCRRPYAKGELSFKLLGEMDATVIMAASPHARAFIETLQGHLGSRG